LFEGWYPESRPAATSPHHVFPGDRNGRGRPAPPEPTLRPRKQVWLSSYALAVSLSFELSAAADSIRVGGGSFSLGRHLAISLASGYPHFQALASRAGTSRAPRVGTQCSASFRTRAGGASILTKSRPRLESEAARSAFVHDCPTGENSSHAAKVDRFFSGGCAL
jgi:hypothetical protein